MFGKEIKHCAACGKKATTERLGRPYCKECAEAGDARIQKAIRDRKNG